MITKREAKKRGHLDFGWLSAKHSFSFGSYVDPEWSGFTSLRVINEDLIKPKKGFDTHPHKDMEIITYVIKGEIEHRDTMGNHSFIKEGEIQVISAGKGVQHSEFNPSSDSETHLLQIWIEPQSLGLEPGYSQMQVSKNENHFKLLVRDNPDEDSDALHINQNAKIFIGSFEKGAEHKKEIDFLKNYWIQIISGSGEINELNFSDGDGFALTNEDELRLNSNGAEFLLFELE